MQQQVLTETDRKKQKTEVMPILPVKGMVVFPYLVMPLMISNQKQTRLVDDALLGGKTVGIFTQKESQEETPQEDDIYKIGTAVSVLKMLRFPDGSVRFLVQGLHRIRLQRVTESEPYLHAEVEILPESEDESVRIEALKRNCLELLKKVVDLSPSVSEEIYISAINQESASKLADYVASNLTLKLAEKQKMLETFAVETRLRALVSHLNREVGVLELTQKIQSQAAHEMTKMQREFMLREQLKAIRRELGEDEDTTTEFDEFRQKIEKGDLPPLARDAAEKELGRLKRMNPSSAEYIVSRTYLDWLVSLPWNRTTEDQLDIEIAARILDEDHHGLTKVKERILEFLAVRKLKSQLKGPIL
ncbi:MAG: LON peptidase substrate-binding domain-containing protein, partial [candidate division Zixibacteria bacterium]|nr:LON peptidase substrate-binding domain-containing protein [candidate division Zixibacteria bacterium]